MGPNRYKIPYGAINNKGKKSLMGHKEKKCYNRGLKEKKTYNSGGGKRKKYPSGDVNREKISYGT